MLFTRVFWMRAAERAIKSAAQAPLLALGMSDVGPVNAFEVDPVLFAGFAAGGALVSLLTSIATAGVGPEGDPSAI